MKSTQLPDNFITIIKNTANKLSGPHRRRYLAEITIEFFNGNARKAERVFGWGRKTIEKGMKELKTGIICVDNYSARGNKKTEEKNPHLVSDIDSVLSSVEKSVRKERNSRVAAKMIRSALVREKGYMEEQLPCEKTILNIISRTGLISSDLANRA